VFKEKRFIYQDVSQEAASTSGEESGEEQTGPEINPTLTEQLEEAVKPFQDMMTNLKHAIAPILDPILEMFGLDTLADVTEEQADRVALAVEVQTQYGQVNFDDNTNPLQEPVDALQPEMDPLRIPTSTSDLPSFGSESRGWCVHHGEPVWSEKESDKNPIYFTLDDMRFLSRDGYDPGQHSSIREFLDQRMETVTFFDEEFEVHPILAARLRLAEANLSAAGITYDIHGSSAYKYRSMAGNGAGRVSNHALGLAVDFNISDNPMEEFPSLEAAREASDFPPYMVNGEPDYTHPSPFIEGMSDAGIRTFEEWTSNGKYDLMHFDLNPNADGTIPWDYSDTEQHGHA